MIGTCLQTYTYVKTPMCRAFASYQGICCPFFRFFSKNSFYKDSERHEKDERDENNTLFSRISLISPVFGILIIPKGTKRTKIIKVFAYFAYFRNTRKNLSVISVIWLSPTGIPRGKGVRFVLWYHRDLLPQSLGSWFSVKSWSDCLLIQWT